MTLSFGVNQSTIAKVETQLEKEINNFYIWASKWKLSINQSKCEHIAITGKRTQAKPDAIKLIGKAVKQTKLVKYLGLWIDTALTFKEHVQKTRARLETKLAMVRGMQANFQVSPKTLRKIYVAQFGNMPLHYI